MAQPPTTREAASPVVVASILIGLLLAGFLVYYFFFRGAASEEPEPVVPPPEQVATEPAETPPPPRPRLDVPPLAKSDEFVRGVVEELLGHPKAAAWLVPDHLAQRFVAAVDNVARDEDPATHLRSLAPGRAFEAREDPDGSLHMAATVGGRHQALATALAGVDTADAVRLFDEMEPLFDEAYRQLGYPDGDFRKTLVTALDRLLETPVPAEIELDRGVDSYYFADPELEALSPAQKQLLRLGPENARRVQAKLRTLRRALGGA